MGPLVDLHGRMVGINTLILSQAGGSQGLGFSAPSNIVHTVYAQIWQFGPVRRGDIGVRAQTVTPILARGLALPRERGVVLADVIRGSPADRAGLRAATWYCRSTASGSTMAVNCRSICTARGG